jgi:hypothetical protein
MNMLNEKRGEISVQTLALGFILIIIGTFIINAVYPIMNALLFTNAAYAPGTYARLLLDLAPLIVPIAIIVLWSRQGA